ncbi:MULTISPECIES: alpha/beta fold hydrolase [unclassified Variovorax]|uniref:alpha/beta fold hydrolase n=1 Tax=unclassified Variovorax TaxID=663243 RepID=UPI001BD241D8|nr:MULTISPECIES: alpha/beta fold hydrolase [unclassified Variovorax]
MASPSQTSTEARQDRASLVRMQSTRKPHRLGTSLRAMAGAAAKRPQETVGAVGRAAGELAKVALGRSAVEPAAGDRRFDDPAWRDNAVYKRVMQGHLALSRETLRLAGQLGLPAHEAARAKMILGIVADALAPTNVLPGNPAAIKRTIETGGLNLARGLAQLVDDWRHNGGMPAMVDESSFEVGENLAATPGDVVFRSEQLELIQYKPQTPDVAGTPLFIVPPQINKYYVWDLAPGRSLIEFLVQQGFQVFVVSWFNPTVAQADWDLPTYVTALEDAVGVAREVTRSDQVHLLGACSGGITSAALLAYLASKGRDWARSLTLLVSILDTDAIADSSMGLFAHLETLELARSMSGARGVLEGKDLAKVFAWLRPNELVFNYWINNYLMGRKPAAFDVLYWNADTTRLPARLHDDFLALLASNAFAQPGGVTVEGQALDLRDVRCDAYILGGRTDHITPWQGCYRTRELLGGNSEFVLTSSGHVQSIVNPPGNKRASFLTNARKHDTPDAFEQGATAHDGSWWPHLAAWLRARSDADRRAPRQAGSKRHPPLCAAPGDYVKQRC